MKRPVSKRSQAGAILLLSMTVLLVGSAYYLSAGMRLSRQIDNEVLDSLLHAKQALIAYAVNYADDYGHNTRGGTGRLPCPSLTPNSTPASSCQINTIGYLPSAWMRDGELMEIDYLERFLDQEIWYSVAADHRFNPAFNKLNSYPGGGLLNVDSMQSVVAVLIAPGSETTTQNRRSVAGADVASAVSEYLEGENADRDAGFTVTERNDILVPIRRSELMPLMERRVLGYVKRWLLEYKANNGYYPYASDVGGVGECEHSLTRGMLSTEVGNCTEPSFIDTRFQNLPYNRPLRNTWFYRSGWTGLIYYIVDESCTSEYALTDCDGIDDPERTLLVNGQAAEVILISVGEPIETVSGMQDRLQNELSHYLDTDELLLSVNDFAIPVLSSHSNDQMVLID